MRTIVHILILTLISVLTFGQSTKDFPSTLPYSTANNGVQIQILRTDSGDIKLKHRILIQPDSGIEYYPSGNVHATGSLVKSNEYSTRNIADSTIEKITEYSRDGIWTMYFDTDSLIIRSQGKFVNGVKDGSWKFFKQKSSIPYLTRTYSKGIVKNEIYISDSGEILSQENKSNFELFLMTNKVLFILLAILPIVLIRITSNIITYNKINGTNYIPGFQKGGVGVNLHSTVIFWWIYKSTDKPEILKSKKTSNIISIVSIIIFVSIMILFEIYGLTEN